MLSSHILDGILGMCLAGHLPGSISAPDSQPKAKPAYARELRLVRQDAHPFEQMPCMPVIAVESSLTASQVMYILPWGVKLDGMV